MLYALAILVVGYQATRSGLGSAASLRLGWWDPELLVQVGLLALAVVGGGSLFKIAQLRGGGKAVAESLGGRLVHSDTRDLTERKLQNVVEEMAIASGTATPPVYMLDDERGINAFAAGFSPSDAVVGVTRGCAEQLSRDELQGVIAHEFSHIMNGDMRLNIRLIGVVHGILIIGIIGYALLRSAGLSRGRGGRDNSGAALLTAGFGLMIIGFPGAVVGRAGAFAGIRLRLQTHERPAVLSHLGERSLEGLDDPVGILFRVHGRREDHVQVRHVHAVVTHVVAEDLSPQEVVEAAQVAGIGGLALYEVGQEP